MGILAQSHICEGASHTPTYYPVLYCHSNHPILQLFNASHMAPYDIPYPAHDMILRFMGMNFSAITSGSALTPSKVGDSKVKPVFQDVSGAPPVHGSDGVASTTPEKDKAMWEGTCIVSSCLTFLNYR